MKYIILLVVFFSFYKTYTASASDAHTKYNTKHSKPISFSVYQNYTDFDKAVNASASNDERIVVHATRTPRRTFFDSSPLHQFDDGHAEREVELAKGFRFTVATGEDIDHDPVTGTNIKRFGEAYADTSPTAHR